MIVGLTSPGHMGAGIGQVLVRHGATVLVSLAGRSDASRARAQLAGLTAIERDDDLADVDVLLSLSPPGFASELAARFAPVLARGARRPVYLDANAVSPQTARSLAATLAEVEVDFCDGGIIGLPPGTASREPTLFVSGPKTEKAEELAAFGLQVNRVDGRIGSASALKMSYAGITKGLIALGAAMIGNAEREGVGAALAAELGASQAHLLAGFRRSIPDMFAKSGRWVAEMQEISSTCPEGSPEAGVYEYFGSFYQAIDAAYRQGQPVDGARRDLLQEQIAALQTFLNGSAGSAN